MTPTVGVVFILVGVMDALVMWKLILPQIPEQHRRTVAIAVLATSGVLIGAGIATIFGLLKL